MPIACLIMLSISLTLRNFNNLAPNSAYIWNNIFMRNLFLCFLFLFGTANASVIAKNFIWQKTKLNFCFLDDPDFLEKNLSDISFNRSSQNSKKLSIKEEKLIPFSQKEKANIISLIYDELLPTVLRVKFLKQCENINQIDIILLKQSIKIGQ